LEDLSFFFIYFYVERNTLEAYQGRQCVTAMSGRHGTSGDETAIPADIVLTSPESFVS
jgi:hypothetical protein